ncbi:hypothetical protein LJR034_000841 [Caballeronia sp. LjRoot34]|uniref:LexA family protein n=1 Tax=Caballeronia sp. LjRoot34 TaxID=3342325 RepID=UPI003ECECBFF
MTKVDASKYLVTIISDSMYDPADLDSLMIGDTLEIDPSLTPRDGDFVIVDFVTVELGEFKGVRKLVIRDGKHLLTWGNPAWTEAIELSDDAKIAGVVSMRSRSLLNDERLAPETEASHE